MVETIDAGAHRYVGAAFTVVDSGAIRVHRERCAKVRNRNVDCLKCAAACTSGCLSLDDGELVIDASKCVGCGHLRHGVPHVCFGIFESVGRRVEGRLPARRAR